MVLLLLLLLPTCVVRLRCALLGEGGGVVFPLRVAATQGTERGAVDAHVGTVTGE